MRHGQNPYWSLLDEADGEEIDLDDLHDGLALPRGWSHEMKASPVWYYYRHGD